jgi:hypothetical protein
MSDQQPDEVLLRTYKAAGNVALGSACNLVASALVPGSGYVAAVASTFLPKRAKDGAAVGAMMGAGFVGKAVIAGIAAPALLPAVALGAAVCGLFNLLFGKD